MKLNHIHKYKRAFLDKYKKTPIYRCILPDCNHYLLSIFIVGKISLCWKCDNQFVIVPATINASGSKPNCGCERAAGRLKKMIENSPDVSNESLDDMMKRLADG